MTNQPTTFKGETTHEQLARYLSGFKLEDGNGDFAGRAATNVGNIDSHDSFYVVEDDESLNDAIDQSDQANTDALILLTAGVYSDSYTIDGDARFTFLGVGRGQPRLDNDWTINRHRVTFQNLHIRPEQAGTGVFRFNEDDGEIINCRGDSAIDIEVDAAGVSFMDVRQRPDIVFEGGAEGCSVVGGRLGRVTFENGATDNDVHANSIRFVHDETGSVENIVIGRITDAVPDWDGTRTIINGRARNSGDPNGTGDWENEEEYAREQNVLIRDTNNNEFYRAMTDSAFYQVNTTAP